MKASGRIWRPSSKLSKASPAAAAPRAPEACSSTMPGLPLAPQPCAQWQKPLLAAPLALAMPKSTTGGITPHANGMQPNVRAASRPAGRGAHRVPPGRPAMPDTCACLPVRGLSQSLGRAWGTGRGWV
ncbi:hypothetical protein DVU_3331 [Nitratidesulfovibrio vulgaris str. Hildenborough]|uniref:Uncharacterized protein n=1 Tax=Nitratidesulfovibrio vulgaris (strain ATCC 29579 / DSM 644 / CCUG 34227 / NCIMB 8303 / VKM B-1760 / Hildenborough) TaxID=882 RepID=Q725U4_NITV2|nr:hypothetical protein DVU_3331 [Nitratidesulfovibrio vulgaris str. Hildenborough]